MEKIKNTLLMVTLASLVTQLVILLLSAISDSFLGSMFDAYWDGLRFTGLGWFSVVIFAACLVLAFYFTTKENTLISSGLGAAAGVFFLFCYTW
jgi:hypothetical protein